VKMNWNLTSNAPMITTMVSATTSFVFVPQDGEVGFCGKFMKIVPFQVYLFQGLNRACFYSIKDG
jgi:hypothetical protein